MTLFMSVTDVANLILEIFKTAENVTEALTL